MTSLAAQFEIERLAYVGVRRRRADAVETPPAPLFCRTPVHRVAGLPAEPRMMTAEVAISAYPRPIVGHGRKWHRRDGLLDHHRLQILRTPSDDICAGNARHRHHEESKQRGYRGCVEFHMRPPDLNTDREMGGLRRLNDRSCEGAGSALLAPRQAEGAEKTAVVGIGDVGPLIRDELEVGQNRPLRVSWLRRCSQSIRGGRQGGPWSFRGCTARAPQQSDPSPRAATCE